VTDESIFAAALALPNPAERAAYLDRACAGKPELRRQVEDLLGAHAASNLLDQPAVAPAATGAFVQVNSNGEASHVGDRIGPYKLMEKIGEGGMGEVWVADQLEPIRRRVALKVIKPGMDSRSVLARFEAERQALALMDHPNIAKVLDAGDTKAHGRTSVGFGRPYFVMELVKGVPITEFCDARKLTPRQRLELFVPVCQAIQHAHQKGIIHRDIKPSNVLVELHDYKPVPKVIDFGVAKAVGQQLTEKTIYTGFGALVGTPAYMAPEQASFNALDIDTRADVYALGVLLYELLAGSPPFEPERLKKAALDEVLRMVREEDPPRPSARVSTSETRASIAAVRQSDPVKLAKLVRGELDWIVMRALEKDRTRRYESANGLAKDVERYLSDEPVEACPPTFRYRMRKYARRNKGRVIAASVVSLALIVGLGGMIYGLVRAEKSLALAKVSMAEESRLLGAMSEQSAEAFHQRHLADESALFARAAEQDARRETAKAIAERDRADKEAALARATEQFLVKQLLAGADPYQTHGKKVTIDEILDRAAAAVGASFAKSPEVEVGIREILGRSFVRLGNHKAAREQLVAAIALRKKLGGDEQAETLISQNDLVEILHWEGKIGEAEKLLRETLETAKRVHGEKHPVSMATLNNLAAQLWRQKRIAEAEPLTRRAYELHQEISGPDDHNTLVALSNLGVQIFDQGRVVEAEPLMLDALNRFQRAYGDKHPGTISAKNNVASLRLGQRRLEEAERLYRETLATATEVLTEQNPKTLQTMNNLAVVLVRRGKTDEVEALYRKVLAILKAHHPADSPWLPTALDNLVVELERQGKLSEAGQYLNELYQVHVRKGVHHPAALAAHLAVCQNLAKRKLWTEAAGQFQSLLAMQRGILKEGDPDVQVAREGLATAYLALNKPADAEPLFRDWLKHSVKLAPPWWREHLVTSWLGESLLAQKKYADAEPLLLSGCRGLRANEDLHNPDVNKHADEARQRLVRLYDEWGKPDEAARWREQPAPKPREVKP
jgi:eukaryotic-like serine/threonine-protein kinase